MNHNSDIVSCLQAKRNQIFKVWEARVRDALPLTRPIGTLTLSNSLPDMYDVLIETLAHSVPKIKTGETAARFGIQHGREQNRLSNYDLNYVIEEYQILRKVIFEIVRKSLPLNEEATDVILEAIMIGIRNATSEFVSFRAAAFAHAQLRAEKANVAKLAFLTNMSHEIRTPLGVILGHAEFLKEPVSRSEREACVQVMSRNGQALTKLVDDVINLSTIESGYLELENISFNVDELLKDVMDQFAASAKIKGVALTVNFDPKAPRRVNSDPTRLRQILINIVGNAVKFTPSGEVSVNVDLVLLENNKDGLRFTISDSGIGMSEEEASTLFEPFSQCDGSLTRNYGGTGLGLVLARRIARCLGGDVQLKCSENKGCCFFVTVEAIGARRSPNISSSIIATLAKVKILFVDDSKDNQDLIKHALNLRGAIVDCADNGKEGIFKAEHNSYDLILMDMQMPVLDGYLATQELRASGFEKPIIALTAHAMIEDQRKSFKAGCNAHITKPIDMNFLVKTIIEFRAFKRAAL